MIEISLFDNFGFTVNGKDVTSVLSASKKGSQMLYYLMLNYGSSVTTSTLFDMLWPDEASSNPESALKTLVSRIRSALGAFDEELSSCIVTTRGAYMWNTSLNCSIDAVRVEAACRRLLSASAMNDSVRGDLDQVLLDYTGDLCVGREDNNYFVTKRAYYHELYIKTILHCIQLFKKEDDSDRIIQLTRTALDIDMFEEQLHMELMEALAKSNRSGDVLSQYRHMSTLQYSMIGKSPTEAAKEFYTRFADASRSMENDIESIKRNLEETPTTPGAFVCDYSIFRDVYQLYMRNLQRLGTPMYLALISLTPVTQVQVEPFDLDKAMHQLLRVMVGCLRRGDTISRYSPTGFALLLPFVNDVTILTVIKRIRTQYYSQYVNPQLAFSYKLIPLGDHN